MNEVRKLEYKYADIIHKHLRKALRGFHDWYGMLKHSSDYQDGNLSFDLIYKLNLVISVRIRKNQYIKYKDMTIRYRSKNGGKTEFDKIKEGYAQIYFYAYENETSTDFAKVRIVDVDAIRKLIDKKLYKVYKNADGTELATFAFTDIYNFNGAIYQYD